MLFPTPYEDINHLLNSLLSRIQNIFGTKFLGFYLYGSLVWGDFDKDISDIDLLAVLSSDVNDYELEKLKLMHNQFVHEYKEWDDRIEVQYFSKQGLRDFKVKSSKMAVISPGEPLHFVSAGDEWLLNWYFVQDYGITLYGPKPTTFIETISKEEFIEAVKKHALEWEEYVINTKSSRPYQAYAILTMCRALYTLTFFEQTSKIKAANWAKKQLADYANLIKKAIEWRIDCRNKNINHEETYPETVEFVNYVIELIKNIDI